MTNYGFCCISATLAARLIGAFDLSTSVTAIILLIGKFLSDENRPIVFDNVKIFLGFNWANESIANNSNNYGETWILVCLMVYSIFQLFSSAFLILATIFKKNNYALPWLTFEIISLANQASFVISSLFHYQCENYETAASFPLASLYLVLGVYFWLIVFAAQKSWTDESENDFLE